jgi:hypothetical protein
MPTVVCPSCHASVGPDDVACQACGKPTGARRMLGEILIDEGLVSPDGLERALKIQKMRLGEVLVEIGACKREDVDRALELQRLGRTRAQVLGRWLRVSLLALLGLTLVVAYLLARIEAHQDLLLRIAQQRLTVDEVDRILAGDVDSYKFEAMRSLAQHLPDKRAVAVLSRGLEDPRWYLRLYAASLAGRARVRALVPALIGLLADEERLVGTVAHDALKTITGQTLDLSLRAWQDWAAREGTRATPGAGPAPIKR